MKYTYSIDQQDYLAYMFYSTSRSKRIMKRRSLNKLILLIIYMVTGLFLYNSNGPVASAVFFLLCLPLYFLYNTFEKKQYLKHFNRFIQAHFKENLGRLSTIEFTDDKFHVVDDEDKWHSYEDIAEIHETTDLFIIQLKSGVAVLIPKSKIENIEAFSNELLQHANTRNIPAQKDLTWKWK